MTHHRLFLVPLLVAALLAGGCKSFKRDFNPPLSTQNDVVKMTVRRVTHKKESLRIWLSLENLSDHTLHLQYGNFTATSAGTTLRGALRVPFVRIDKDFEMPPRYMKHIGQPIEFIGFDAVPAVELRLVDIRVEGREGAAELAIQVPVHGGDQ